MYRPLYEVFYLNPPMTMSISLQSTTPTYYDLLKIPRNATPEQIRDSYKELAKIFHPDSNFFDEIIDVPVSNGGQDTFKELTKAYTTLSNPEKRRAYDATLPPVLYGWDSESEEKDFQTEVRLTKLAEGDPSERPASYATFGKGIARDEDEPEVDNPEEYDTQVGGIQGFFRKILGG